MDINTISMKGWKRRRQTSTLRFSSQTGSGVCMDPGDFNSVLEWMLNEKDIADAITLISKDSDCKFKWKRTFQLKFEQFFLLLE